MERILREQRRNSKNQITVQSFAKINLSLDVGEVQDGYHAVDMVMQQLAFHDDVTVRYLPQRPSKKRGEKGTQSPKESDRKFSIHLRTSRYYLPTDERNLAYKAAQIMIERYGEGLSGGYVEIYIKKRIPVAAGMAGGSGNGAAVVHALNILWDLHLSLAEICEICAKLGSDVPFSAVGQAIANRHFPSYLQEDAQASACARATGRGILLKPLPAIRKCVVIAKPSISVSTAEVYRGIDQCEIRVRPDNDRLEKRLPMDCAMYEDFVNVLENYTLNAYPKVEKLKERMQGSDAEVVLMSGSGPTVFAIFAHMKDAKRLSDQLRAEGYEAYWTRTTW